MGSREKSNQSSSSQNVSNNQGVSSGVNMNYGVNQSGNFGQNSSMGGSSGGGSSFNQSQQNVYGAQAPYLQDVYGQAQNAFNQGMSDVQGMRPEVQQQLGDALGAAGEGYGNQMGGGFASGLAGKIGPNTYTDAMKAQIANDANELRQQSLGSLDARAAAAGMSGSSGYRDQVAGMNDDVNEQALNAMTNVGYNSFNQGMSDVQGMRPEVQDQLGDALAAAGEGYGNQMGGGFASGLAGKIGPNTYTDAMKAQIANDANELRQQSLGSLDARAAAAGMSGSSGYRDQVAGMNDDINEQALNAMTNVGYNSFNQGIQNQMQLAGMMDRNQQGAMGNLQNIQQGSMNQFNPAMLGQNMAGQYAQTIGGPTVLGNSSGGSSNFNNSFNQSQGTNMGFSNGMNMGMGVNGSTNFGNSFGSSTGQGNSSSTTIDGAGLGAGLTAIFPSDALLKENIKHVEQIDGINMYTWDWKDPAASSSMNYGVIAQEVAETHPEAVVTGDHGYLMVDYSKLGRAGEVALARMEG